MSDYIVLVKQVPDVSQITDNAFDPETGTLVRSRLANVINELDAQALAFASHMKTDQRRRQGPDRRADDGSADGRGGAAVQPGPRGRPGRAADRPGAGRGRHGRHGQPAGLRHPPDRQGDAQLRRRLLRGLRHAVGRWRHRPGARTARRGAGIALHRLRDGRPVQEQPLRIHPHHQRRQPDGRGQEAAGRAHRRQVRVPAVRLVRRHPLGDQGPRDPVGRRRHQGPARSGPRAPRRP